MGPPHDDPRFERMDQIDETLDRHKLALDSLDSAISRLATRVDNHRNLLTKVNVILAGRLSALEEKFDRCE